MLNTTEIKENVSSYIQRILATEPVKPGQIASLTLPIREINLRSLPTTDRDWLFWSHPSDNETILGLGCALHIAASGCDRLETINRELQQTDRNWLDPEQTGCKPLSYLCFAFNPDDTMTGPWSGLPNSSLFLPELTIHQQNNSCVITFSVDLRKNREIASIHQRWMMLFTIFLNSINQQHAAPGCKTTLTRISTSANHEQWNQLISRAQNSISSGVIEKVVPARHLRVRAERNLDPSQLLTALNYLYPNSMVLGSRLGGRTFISATPERLVSYQNGRICCDALAGTISRSATEKNDHDLGQMLLSDPKARHEHHLVVQDISTSLKAICPNIKYQKQPTLLRLRNLQHLHTEITGQIKPGISLLQTIATLHPTAAVNGYPKSEANSWLTQNESIERGWYSGAAGWIDYSGNGKLAVLLRCALLDNNYADLFAGAGITAESDADAEYAETELKFGVMLEALENA